MDPASPVIVLAFADAVDARDRLRLRDEQRAIEAALASLPPAQIRVVSFATRRAFFDALDRDNDRIVAVHFAGHADNAGLRVEDEQGQLVALLGPALADRLGALPALELLVLNGCNTASHAEALRRCCPGAAMLLSQVAIDDRDAVTFSRRLYTAMASGAAVDDAFGRARDELSSDPEAIERLPPTARMLRPSVAITFSAWTLIGGDRARGFRLDRRLAGAPIDVASEHISHTLASLVGADRAAAESALDHLSAHGRIEPAHAGTLAPDVIDALSHAGLIRRDARDPPGLILSDARLAARADALRRARHARRGRRVLAIALALATAAGLGALGVRLTRPDPCGPIEVELRTYTAESLMPLRRAFAQCPSARSLIADLPLDPRDPAVWSVIAEPGDATADRARLALVDRLLAETGAGDAPRVVEAERFGRLLEALDMATDGAGQRMDRALADRVRQARGQVLGALRARFPSVPALRDALVAEMIPLPGGVFVMGSPPGTPGRRADEAQRPAIVPPFALSRAAITRAQFARFFDSGPWRPARDAEPDARGRGALPETAVSWYEARAFAEWLGLRLPTEAEWAFAAYGRSDGSACAADAIPQAAGLIDITLRPAPADGGIKRFHGLRGNVPVWCVDRYAAGPGWLPDWPYPRGAPRGALRVQRGAGPGEPPSHAGCTRRFAAPPTRVERGVGVRLVCDGCVSLQAIGD